MGRGREPIVMCYKCNRRVPRNKAVEITKGMSFDLGEQQNVIIDVSQKKAYYCISCGKHLKVFEKKKEMLARNREREEI